MHANQPKKIFMLRPKKNHTRNLITKKNSCGSKILHPPITFLMVRPLWQKYHPITNLFPGGSSKGSSFTLIQLLKG